MFRNYFKTGWRALVRYRMYTAINVISLSIGFLVALLTFLFILSEFSYEKMYPDRDHIYRLVSSQYARTSPNLAPFLKNELSEVHLASRVKSYSGICKSGDISFYEDNIYFANQDYLSMFPQVFIDGGPQNALSVPNQAIITESVAQRYFGATDVVGRTLTLLDTLEIRIAGVIRDLPHNTHFKWDMMISFETYENFGYNTESWSNQIYYTYVQVDRNTPPDHFIRNLEDFQNRNIRVLRGRENYQLEVQPILDIHLHSDKRMEVEANSDIRYAYIFGSIALLILLMAVINFVNIATSMASRRSREVGVRKAVGGLSLDIGLQFIVETLVISVLSFALSVALVVLVLPFLNQLADTHLTVFTLLDPINLLVVTLAVIIIGSLAGLYPAWSMAALRPVHVFRRQVRLFGSTIGIRRALVGTQFLMAFVLIFGTLVIQRQIGFLIQRPLGFDKDQVLVLDYHYDSEVLSEFELIKEQLLSIPGISAATLSGDVPGRMATLMSAWVEGMPLDEYHPITTLYTGKDFVPTYGIQVVTGRDYNNDMPTDIEEGYLINEQAADLFGWSPGEAVGKKIDVHKPGKILGVVGDFHFYSLRESIEPLVMGIRPEWAGYISLRIDPSNVRQTLAQVEETWASVMPERPMDYFFLDEDFQRQYAAERRLGSLSSILTFISICIASLGLFGLAFFTCEYRSKEIAIRKISGAGMKDIIAFLGFEFFRPIGIAVLIAMPFAYWLAHIWLRDFAFGIQLGADMFFIVFGLLIFVTILSISYHLLRTSRMRPVRFLREE